MFDYYVHINTEHCSVPVTKISPYTINILNNSLKI